jgi:hypothetical protein
MGDERVERRLAAILAADVVGYSRLVGIDEEGTLAALKALRKSSWERPDGVKVRLPPGAQLARIRGASGPQIFVRQES